MRGPSALATVGYGAAGYVDSVGSCAFHGVGFISMKGRRLEMKRIRDLIAAEGELGDAKEQVRELEYLLRQVFYSRMPLGNKIEEYLDKELWDKCYAVLSKWTEEKESTKGFTSAPTMPEVVAEIEKDKAIKKEWHSDTSKYEETCSWCQDDDGVWQTKCGNSFILNHGGPTENKMAYCQYCGKRLEEKEGK